MPDKEISESLKSIFGSIEGILSQINDKQLWVRADVIKLYHRLVESLAKELSENLDIYKFQQTTDPRGYDAGEARPIIASLVGKLERQFGFNPQSQPASPINLNISASAENNNVINVNQTLQSVMSLAESPEDKQAIQELMKMLGESSPTKSAILETIKNLSPTVLEVVLKVLGKHIGL